MSPAAPVLAAQMQAAASEVYLIDEPSRRLVDVNQTARDNLGYDFATLTAMTPFDLAPGLSETEFGALLAGLGEGVGAQACLRTRHRRADGSSYPITLHFLRTQRDGQSLILALGDDRSAEQAAEAALEQFQARFNAIASNMPGLVFQFLIRPDGSPAYPYLSDSCQQLLGLTVAQLQQEPRLFLARILPADRAGYRASMLESARTLSTWNWEGRIWVEHWNDEKWINLRAIPRALLEPRGSVQWDGIMTNISDSKREQAALSAAHDRLAELTAHIEDAKEEERARIAREIHDDLGGNLTAIKMALALLSKRLPDNQPQLRTKADYLDALVDRTIEAVHRISLDLRPAMLDLGLPAALEWQAREFEEQNGIACSFTSSDKELDLSLEHATALFRIVQEALTNIAKHARASAVAVRLAHAGERLTLEVEDNGIGLGPADRQKPHSFGLRGMDERAHALGGSLSVANAHGGGTVVAISIPFSPAHTDNSG